MPVISIFKWLHVSTLWVYRAVTWAVLGSAFVFSLVILGVRFWLDTQRRERAGEIVDVFPYPGERRLRPDGA